MNWLNNFVRPKLRELVGQKEIPENLWNKCPSCGQMIFHRELEKNLQVCQHCGHHMRLPAQKRLEMLFDGGEFQPIELPETIVDPLKFRDRKRYTDRIKESQTKTGTKDALRVAHGTMGGMNVVVAILDFDFMGGSMGVAVGEGLITGARLAVLQNAPLIVVVSSGGARMQEGVLSLMQMARSTIAVEEIREAGLPYIVVLTDPTTGGVSASFAMLGDIAISEPGAVIGFAGQRVIEQTIRETLPEGFQRAEYLLDHGMLDMVVPRHQLRDTLVRVLSILSHPTPPADIIAIPPKTAARDDEEKAEAEPKAEAEAEAEAEAKVDPAPAAEAAADSPDKPEPKPRNNGRSKAKPKADAPQDKAVDDEDRTVE